MKDLKKLLAEAGKDAMPGDEVKNSIKERLGYGNEPQTLAYAHGGVKTQRRNMIIALTAAALAIIICLAIILPVISGNNRNNPSGTHDKFSEITDANSFYAYSAASVGLLLTSNGGSAEIVAATAYSSPVINRSKADTADIDPYISLIESLLSENNIVSEDIEGADGYEFGMSVKCIDFSGETISYSMYYNKTFLKDKVKDDKQESSYAINGVLHAGNGVYPVDGTFETETESDEQECELYFKAYTANDKKSYIEVERESQTEEDEEEYEFVYSVYEQGKLVEKTSVKYEYEAGETEIELIIKKGDVTQKLKFESEISGKETVLAGKGEINGNKVKVRVYGSNGNREYVFYD